MSEQNRESLQPGLPEENPVAFENEQSAPEPEPPIIRSKFLFVLLILLVIMIPIVGFLAIGIPADPASIVVGDIVLQEDGRLAITLHTSDSALVFCMAAQSLEGNDLYLRPRLSFSSFLHSSGDMTVITKLPSDRFATVSLQGSHKEEPILIWP